MNPNALVFLFGAISSGMIGLVFAYKWLVDGRRSYDLFWAWGHLVFGAAVSMAALHYQLQQSLFGMAAVALLWAYAVLMIRANFAYLCRTQHVHLWTGLCVACAALSLGLGLYRLETGLTVLAPIAAAFALWTGWILRTLPGIGRAALLVFALRAVVALGRPYFADSPWLPEYSLVSLTLALL